MSRSRMNHRLPSHQRCSCKQRCPCSPQVHRYHKCLPFASSAITSTNAHASTCCRRNRIAIQCRHRHTPHCPIASKSFVVRRISVVVTRRIVVHPLLQIHHTCRRVRVVQAVAVAVVTRRAVAFTVASAIGNAVTATYAALIQLQARAVVSVASAL